MELPTRVRAGNLWARMARPMPIVPPPSGLTRGTRQPTASGVLDGAWGAALGAWVEAGVLGAAAGAARGGEVAHREENTQKQKMERR